jgi:WD40 repeat protein/tetratricopeptide (TPR) repeat protein
VDESEIFTNALKLAAPAERAAYLDQACAGNPQLRADVEALLQAHARDSGFLEQPVGSLAGTMDEPPAAGAPDNPPPGAGEGKGGGEPTEQPGLVLAGRYKLLEVIGEGGMGTVWMAQQTEPVKRLVAVKLIRTGLSSGAVLARFEAERQALAIMDHPNIAKVFDAGTTHGEPGALATGGSRPFFVMELVKGIPITRFCDEHRLTPRQRLELFVPVCQAVQHAHQKGVIHRDLKPSNVLVALYDDRPVPKVIDFGVAKAAGQPLTEQTLHTGFGAVVGTVEYMSPEQASFNQLDVDTRSDIYSLGVLLYELLTGSPPFSAKELEKAGVLELLRVIREQEPPRPSSKLSTTERLPTLAANRGMEPKRLTALLRGELDWVVMKCLEKDRSRRYETANALALDVQRYLADERVQACPPSAGYRLRKFVRRNRGVVLAVSLVVLALVGGIIGTAWQAIRATRAAQGESQQRQRADQKAAEAETNERLALAQKRRADDKADEALRRLVRQYVVNGARHLDENDLLGSLPWFVEALALERDPDRRPMHRMRLGSLLRLAPRLEQVWTHEGSLRDATFSPDGQWVATAGAGTDRLGLIQVWDARSGRPVTPPLRHRRANWPPEWEQPVYAVAFSPDGKRLASANVGEVVIWDVASGTRLASWDQPDHIYRMRFTPDGARLLLTWAKNVSRDVSRLAGQVWDARAGKPVSPLITSEHIYGYSGEDGDVVFSPDGRRLALTERIGGRAVARVVDVATGKDLFVLKPARPDDPFRRLAYTPDGKRLLTTTSELGARLWDADTGKALGLMGHVGAFTHQAYSADGSRLLTFDAAAFVWDMASGNRTAMFRPEIGTIRSADLSADGLRALTVTEDGTLQVWDVSGSVVGTTTPIGPALRLVDADASAKFSPDGRQVLVAAGGRQAWLWQFGTFEPGRPTDNTAWMVRGPTSEYRSEPDVQRLGPDGNRLAVARDGRLRLFDAITGRAVGEPTAYTGGATHLVFAADGRALALVSHPEAPGGQTSHVLVRRYDPENGRQLGKERTIAAERLQVLDPALRWAAVTRRDPKDPSHRHLILWDMNAAKPESATRDHGPDMDAVAFSHGGDRFLTRSGDALRVWDTLSGAPLGPAFLQPGFYGNAAFAPDGERLLVAYSATPGHWGDGRARLWDVRAGRLLFELPGRGLAIYGITLSTDGTRIATAGGRTARVWDAASGKPLTPPMRHRYDLQAVVFGGNGRAILTTGFPYQTQLWDAGSGDPLTPPLSGGVFPALTPEGLLLLQGDSTVLYDVRSDERPVAELRLLAQGLCGHRIDDTGGSVPLSDEEHAAVWQRLRQEHPAAQPTSPERERAWRAAQADACERAGHWADAAAHLTPLIEAQPYRWRLWARRGRAWLEAGESDKAVADLTFAIDRGAEDPSVWLDRGNAHAEQGHFREAAADFAHAGTMGEHVEPWQALALLGAGDRPGYRAACARILRFLNQQTQPSYVVERLTWPLVLPAGENLDLSTPIAHLEKTVADNKTDSEALRTLGAALLRAGKIDDAVRRLDEACRLEPDSLPSAWLLRAIAYHRAGKTAEAKKSFARATRWLDNPANSAHLDWQDRLKLRLLRLEYEQSTR